MKKTLFCGLMLAGLVSLYGCGKSDKAEEKKEEIAKTTGDAATLFSFQDAKNKAKEIAGKAEALGYEGIKKFENTKIGSATEQALQTSKNLAESVEDRAMSAANTVKSMTPGKVTNAIADKVGSMVKSGVSGVLGNKAALNNTTRNIR